MPGKTLGLVLVLPLFSFFFLLGCSRSDPKSNPSPDKGKKPATGNADPDREARKVFALVCAPCHGNDGAGNGPGSANLQPKPRNYHDKVWQASITDEQISKIIIQGGAAMGKSSAMPNYPQLADKPEIATALVKLIRSFNKN